MTSSFRKIDYSLRPAKHAARRMLCEIFGRLHPFQRVNDYTYVGFGSVWFADFLLFHRRLGVEKMISIERDTAARSRVEANKPFRTITVHYKNASRILPTLDWSGRHFVWVDYEDPVALGIMVDISTVVSRASSGSVLAVSIPCQRAKEVELAEKDGTGPSAIERFRSTFGDERVRQDISELDLEGWSFGSLSREMIKAEIQAALTVRNGSSAGRDMMSFRPICDFEYNDGTKMITVVGILVAAKDISLFRECGFDRLDFMPPQGKLVRIRVPKLTAREVRRLEQELPKLAGSALNRGQIPADDARALAKFYRYLPSFAVLET